MIEEAVAETCARQDADEAVDEQGVEQLVLDLLLTIQTAHKQISQQ